VNLRLLVSVGALALAGLAAVWPWAAFPSLLAVLLASVVTSGRMRLVVAVLGGALSLVGLTRFVVGIAAPNIVDGGRHSSEERAVDRLREIRWAELRAKEVHARDENHDGVGEFLFLDELAGAGGRHLELERPILTGVYLTPQAGGVFLSDAYLYVIYLPSPKGSLRQAEHDGEVDAAAAAQHFVAYAWPLRLDQGGGRAFSIDEHDQICESTNQHAGESQLPVADAAEQPGASCGSGSEGPTWHRWARRERKLPVR